MENIQVGSTILGLERCRDTDILVIDDGHKYSWFDKPSNYNYHPRSYERIKSEMAFESAKYWDQFYAYMLDSEINPNNLDYNVFDHKDKILSCVKNFNFDRLYMVPDKYRLNDALEKKVYHVAYNTFLLINDSKILTPEQKIIIQKIHDREMPLEYGRELEGLIKNL